MIGESPQCGERQTANLKQALRALSKLFFYMLGFYFPDFVTGLNVCPPNLGTENPCKLWGTMMTRAGVRPLWCDMQPGKLSTKDYI